jgi:hypothetical protein
LETGGGRFRSELEDLLEEGKESVNSKMKTSRKRRRKSVPGRVLRTFLLDFKTYDDSKRARERHMPAASLHGVDVRLGNPEFSCGVLRRAEQKDKDHSIGTVKIQKVNTMTKVVNQIFKYAKKVGTDLAKSHTPPENYPWKKNIPDKEKAVMLNCTYHTSSGEGKDKSHSHSERGGIMQNLADALQILHDQKKTFPDATSLVTFLEDAVEMILKGATHYCKATIKDGHEHCSLQNPLAKCQHKKMTTVKSKISSENKKELEKVFNNSLSSGTNRTLRAHLIHEKADSETLRRLEESISGKLHNKHPSEKHKLESSRHKDSLSNRLTRASSKSSSTTSETPRSTSSEKSSETSETPRSSKSSKPSENPRGSSVSSTTSDTSSTRSDTLSAKSDTSKSSEKPTDVFSTFKPTLASSRSLPQDHMFHHSFLGNRFVGDHRGVNDGIPGGGQSSFKHKTPIPSDYRSLVENSLFRKH